MTVGRALLLNAAILAAAPATAAPATAAPIDDAAAQAVIAGCAAHATAKRQSHAIAIVDPGGHTVAALRMDGNVYDVIEFARAKAGAVAAWGSPTSGLASGAERVPGFAAAPHVVTVPGGLPIWSADGSEHIGAVGVSGEAPADDVACAAAGIAAAGL